MCSSGLRRREGKDANDGGEGQTYEKPPGAAQIAESENKNETGAGDDIESAPSILRFWAKLYRAIPKLIKVPLTNVDITMAVASAIFLHILRLILTPIMVNYYGWPEGNRWTKEAVASVVSMLHAALLVPSLYICLRTQPYKPCARFDEAPLWWSDASKALMMLCTGYMLQDTVFGVFVPNYVPGVGIKLTTAEIPFIGHHVITVSYMLLTLIVGGGHISAMMLMFLGEFTNPMFNSFLMASNSVKLNFCCGMTPELFQPIAVVNSFFYVLFRAILSPPFIFHLGYDLLLTKDGRKNLPFPFSCYCFLCGLVVLHGSAPWVTDAADMLKDAYNGFILSDRIEIES
jgi:hypothetical protein